MDPEPPGPPPLVIGVGNRDRGDDAVGPIVANRLARHPELECEVAVVEGDLSDLALRWRPDQAVIVVDAVRSSRPPGTVIELSGAELTAADLATGTPMSSHGIGLGQAIELASHLGRLPASLTVVGIEATRFEHGAALTAPVAAAADEATARILALVQAVTPHPAVHRTMAEASEEGTMGPDHSGGAGPR